MIKINVNLPVCVCACVCMSQVLRDVSAGDVVLTQVILSYSGRMLFTGTSSGCVRCVRFPLTDTGEFAEHQVHSAPITRVSCIHV